MASQGASQRTLTQAEVVATLRRRGAVAAAELRTRAADLIETQDRQIAHLVREVSVLRVFLTCPTCHTELDHVYHPPGNRWECPDCFREYQITAVPESEPEP